MSSHHIVREKQEPALLILSLSNFSEELLGQLLEWSPTVITSIAVAEKLNAMGIKVDKVIVDSEELQNVQSDVKYLISNGQPLLTAAMDFLIAENYAAVNIIAEDEPLQYFEPFISAINIVILHGDNKIYPVTSGFSKWLPAGELIRIHSSVTDLTATGLKCVATGNFITTDDGVFALHFKEPYIFISELL